MAHVCVNNLEAAGILLLKNTYPKTSKSSGRLCQCHVQSYIFAIAAFSPGRPVSIALNSLNFFKM